MEEAITQLEATEQIYPDKTKQKTTQPKQTNLPNLSPFQMVINELRFDNISIDGNIVFQYWRHTFVSQWKCWYRINISGYRPKITTCTDQIKEKPSKPWQNIELRTQGRVHLSKLSSGAKTNQPYGQQTATLSSHCERNIFWNQNKCRTGEVAATVIRKKEITGRERHRQAQTSFS